MKVTEKEFVKHMRIKAMRRLSEIGKMMEYSDTRDDLKFVSNCIDFTTLAEIDVITKHILENLKELHSKKAGDRGEMEKLIVRGHEKSTIKERGQG